MAARLILAATLMLAVLASFDASDEAELSSDWSAELSPALTNAPVATGALALVPYWEASASESAS